MSYGMNMFRTAAIGAAAFVLAACSDGRSPLSPEPQESFDGAVIRVPGPAGATVEFDLRVPEDVLDAHVFAFNSKNYRIYRRLLRTDFEFFPRPGDVQDLPWMTGDSWGRADELIMTGNMFGFTDSGPEEPVDSIDLTATVQQITDVDADTKQIRIGLEGVVLATPTDGWSFDTRLDVELVRVGELWGIASVTELDAFANGRRVEEGSWALVKALFR